MEFNKVTCVRSIGLEDYNPKQNKKITESLVGLLCVGEPILILMAVFEYTNEELIKLEPSFIEAVVISINKNSVITDFGNVSKKCIKIPKKVIKTTNEGKLFVYHKDLNINISTFYE